MSSDVMSMIDEAAQVIRQTCPLEPEVLMVLGSGLGQLAEAISQPVILPYDRIPGFPRSTVPGHAGQLVTGLWQGRRVAVMQGRFHYYEGYAMQEVVMPVRAMQRLGVRTVILTNAAGGVNPAFSPGDLMLIRDHIGLWAESPLRGMNLDAIGPRFPDQSRVYDRDMLQLALQCALTSGVAVHQGVYAWCRGPQFETPAEIRLLGLLGADAVGMSTVPEAIAASHGGMRVLALSCITNMAAGLLDQPLSHQEVMEVGSRAASGTIRLLSAILEEMA